MLLSAALLLRELSEVCELPRKVDADERTLVGRPLFFRRGMEISQNRTYICRAADLAGALPPMRGPALLLCIGAEAKLSGAAARSAVALPGAVDGAELCNSVQDIFDRYEVWDDSLRQIAEGGGSISELLDCAAAVLGNPIAVCAGDFSVTARSDGFAKTPEFLEKQLPPDVMERVRRDRHALSPKGPRRASLVRAADGGPDLLSCSLFEQGAPSYCVLAVAASRAFLPGDAPLLERASQYIEAMLPGARYPGRAPQKESRAGRAEALLRGAVSSETADQTPIANGLSDLGWLKTHAYCCFAVRVAAFDSKTYSVRVLCAAIEQRIPHALAFEHGGNVVLVVNLTLHGGGADDVIRQNVYFFRDNFLKVGAGNEVTGFSDMYYCHRQARIALEYACRQQSYHWTLRFDGIAQNYLLEQAVRELPIHAVCAKNLLSLRRHDETHGTEYYKTLERYVRNRFNALKTAKELFIHRSTFLYRLERIRELFSIDLDDDATFFYLLISMKLLEMNRAADAAEE